MRESSLSPNNLLSLRYTRVTSSATTFIWLWYFPYFCVMRCKTYLWGVAPLHVPVWCPYTSYNPCIYDFCILRITPPVRPPSTTLYDDVGFAEISVIKRPQLLYDSNSWAPLKGVECACESEIRKSSRHSFRPYKLFCNTLANSICKFKGNNFH